MDIIGPVLADLDVGSIVKLIAVFVFLIIPVIGQFLAKLKQVPPPAERPNPPPVQPDVADEIEQFMRRAAEKKAEQRPEQRPMRRPRPVVIEEPRLAKPVAAEVVPERPVGGQVGEHVAKYLEKSDFSNREGQLGQTIAGADQQISQHLHSVFDHRVSNLESLGGEAAKAPAAYEPPDLVGALADTPDSFATGLLALVTNPDSLRQAIILNEILHRPEERWS